MYFLRKTFELAICLLGYWLGRIYGGWGGGILLAFAGLCASSFGWEWFVRDVLKLKEDPGAVKHFIFGVVSTILVAVAAYLLWGK
jgi:formate/nitrite transporter FocA (FNT family)